MLRQGGIPWVVLKVWCITLNSKGHLCCLFHDNCGANVHMITHLLSSQDIYEVTDWICYDAPLSGNLQSLYDAFGNILIKGALSTLHSLVYLTQRQAITKYG